MSKRNDFEIKDVLTLGVGVAIIILISKIFPKNPSGETLVKVKSDIQKYKQQGMRATYPEASYNSFADSAFEGMRYSWLSDDYGLVETILKKMYNSLDVAMLIDAYGLRQEENFGIPSGSPKSLFAQVNADLGQLRINRINDNWKSKNIKYQI